MNRSKVVRVLSDHEAVRDVVRAVATDDLELLCSAIERLHQFQLWPDAMRALRQAGLLSVRPGPFGETVDLFTSRAFAVCDHQLAHVEGAENAVFVEGDLVGPVLLVGQGAGGRPTA